MNPIFTKYPYLTLTLGVVLMTVSAVEIFLGSYIMIIPFLIGRYLVKRFSDWNRFFNKK